MINNSSVAKNFETTISSSLQFKLIVIAAFLICSVVSNKSVAQCTSNVPTYVIDMTGSPDSIWNSPQVVREGNCCGTVSPDRCIRFIVTLDPNAVALNFFVTSGSLSPGSLFYQVGCGPPVTYGNYICISGVGPHEITFCKPGNNTNTYQVVSIPSPIFPEPDTVRAGCSQPLEVLGLVPSSITWNSIFPGPSGAYNSYLSCTSNCASPDFTPGPGAPPYIDYRVCGFPQASACGFNFTVCDTVRVYTAPALVGSVTPNPASYCPTSPGVTLSVSASGGVTPYQYSWKNPLGVTVGTGTTYFASSPGTYSLHLTDGLSGCPATVINIPVTVANITLTPSQTNVTCNGSFNGQASVTASGGSAPYSYMWSNLQTTQSITGLPANSYTVTVTDAGGCTASTTINITQPSSLSASIFSPVQGTNGTNISCNGQTNGEATATASGGVAPYTYQWNTGTTTQTINNLSAGFYEVTITDQNGCLSTDTLTLTQPDTLVVLIDSVTFNSGSTIQCFGSNNGEVTAIVNGGTAPYTYNWSTGASTPGITNQPAGPVSITVQDANGCTAGPVSFIFVQPTPFSSGITSPTYAGGYNITCTGASDGSIDYTVSGASPPYTYFWSNGATTQDLSGIPAGTYTVTATDFNGCTTSSTITLTEPSLFQLTLTSPTNPAGYNIGCNGETNGTATANPSGGTSPYLYSWSTGATTATVTNLGAGSYVVTVTDANGCELNDGITLTQPDTVVALISSVTVIGGTNATCYGAADASATVDVTGGTPPYIFNWSNGSTNDTISGIGAGTISVLVMDSNGCSDTDEFTITEPDSMQSSITASIYNGGYNVSCNANTDGVASIFVFGGTEPYTFLWSNGGSSDFINGIGSGIYSVTVTDANGCTLQETIELIQPDPLINIMTPFEYPSGNNISCTGASDGSITLNLTGGTTPYSYQWSHGPSTADVSGLSAGPYTVTVTDDNGCTTSGTVLLNEPPLLTIDSITSAVYPGGWNISCNGGTDGSINSSVSGGSLPYAYYWSNDETTQNISGVSVATWILTVTDVNGCTDTASITLTEPALLTSSITPIASTGGTPVSCAGGSDGGADLTVSGGTAPYTFLWSTGDSTQDLSDVPAGTYYVTITDANGCTATDTVVITDPTILTTSVSSSTYAGGTNISCSGGSDGSVTLTVGGGSPGYTYLWSNSATTQNLSSVSSGNYTVTVTDVNGCTSTASITLTEPAPVQAALSPATYIGGSNVSCNGAADGAIDLTPSGGTAPYTYLWSDNSTSEDITGLTAASYTVTVTDVNNCTQSATIVLNEPVILTGTLVSPVFAGGYNVSCGGTDGSINLTVNGGTAAYTFLWSNGETTQNIDSLAAGNYTVTITDANGCTFSDNITLSQPGAYSSSISSPTFAGGYNISCSGASDGSIDLVMSGGTPPYIYNWSTGDTTQDLAGLSPGLYTVTVTDDNNCTLTSSITLTEPEALQSQVSSPLNPGGYNISCFGGANGSASVTGIDGTPGYNYVWSTGSTAASLNGLSAGTIYVTVTDANNCSVTDSVTLTEPPILAVNSISSPQYPGGWNISCNGGDDGAVNITVIGGAPGYSYLWSNGDTTQNISNVSVTIYIVTVTDVNGCTASNSITLTEPQLLTSNAVALVKAGGSNISCFGGSDGDINLTVNGGTAPYTYLWSDGSTVEDPSGLSAGTYTVTITDANGCITNDSVTLVEPAGMSTNTVTSNYNGSGVSCNNVCDGNIDLTVSGGAAPYTYLWSNNATSQDLNNICSGTYNVTITDANGCTMTDGGVLTQPAANTVTETVTDYNGFGVSCNNSCDGSITINPAGGTAPYSILWNTGSNSPTIDLLCTGVYNYTVTDANNCIVTNNVTITQPQSVSVTSTITNASCFSNCDGSINLNVTGGSGAYSYQWSSGQTTENISGACAGNYTVTVTDNNGCTSSASYAITQPLQIAVSAGTDQFICGSNASLSANVPALGSGTWSVVAGNANFVNANNPFTNVSALSPGLNTLMWTVTEGLCTNSATVNIFVDEMVTAIVQPDDTICEREYLLKAELPAIGSGYWITPANSSAVIVNPYDNETTVTNLNVGFNPFYWIVTNGNCSDTARVIIFIDGAQQCDSLTMPTGISPNGDGYNDDFVVLGLLKYPDNELLIFNRWGNEVYYERGYANTWKGVNKSGENLPDGTYFVILKVNSINRVLKGYVDIRR